jgi:hypothetical protein
MVPVSIDHRTLADFRGLHRGDTIIVCGCGPSLNLLTTPERVITIGVNDVGRRFTPDYLVVLNPRSQFSGDRFKYVEQSRAKALFTQLADGISTEAPIVRFRLGKYRGTDLTIRPSCRTRRTHRTWPCVWPFTWALAVSACSVSISPTIISSARPACIR